MHIRFVLRSTSHAAQRLLVDLRVHFVKANGSRSPKVFKLKRVDLPPRGRMELATSVSLAVHTTRTPRRGRHVVDVLVNGTVLEAGAFHVVEEPRRSGRFRGSSRSRSSIGTAAGA